MKLFLFVTEHTEEDGKITKMESLITAPSMMHVINERKFDFMDEGFDVIEIRQVGDVVEMIPHDADDDA